MKLFLQLSMLHSLLVCMLIAIMLELVAFVSFNWFLQHIHQNKMLVLQIWLGVQLITDL